jgi:type I pantothenate kinase
MTTPSLASFATLDRAAWAALAPGEPGDDVLGPLARLVAVRREQDLRRRSALAELSGALVRGGPGARGYVVAVAGGVAAGKSRIAGELAALLEEQGAGPVARVSTDDLLLPNAELEARGLTERKGFPESYDHPALLALLDAVRAGEGPVEVPVYAHRLQDRVPGEATTVDRPAVLVLEGLRSLAGPEPGEAVGVRDRVDLGVYVDAADEHARGWYLERFRSWRVDAADDPGSFLHPLRAMPDDEADALALRVWDAVNAPNVRDHVLPTREHADVVLRKGAGHAVTAVLVRRV